MCSKLITSKHNLSVIFGLCLLYSYCNRENQHPPALPSSAVGQKGEHVQFFGDIILV